MSAARCGTTSGYTRHQLAGEKPCDACAAAKRAYDKRWRSASAQTRKSRLKARAQGRAYAELGHRYPSEYRALYEKHKKALEDEQ